MLFPPRAVERAMQIKEVLLRAMNKEYSWLRAAEILGITPRGLRRLLQRMLGVRERVRAVLRALQCVSVQRGSPACLYTDRAGWAFETQKAGEKVSKTHLTQLGQALHRLGIEHIPSYSPQARGRSERMNRTLQDRLVNELKAAGASTMEKANAYLRERYITTHNEFL